MARDRLMGREQLASYRALVRLAYAGAELADDTTIAAIMAAVHNAPPLQGVYETGNKANKSTIETPSSSHRVKQS